MSLPDWFDNRLKASAPRAVANAWTLHLLRGFLAATAGFLAWVPILHGDPPILRPLGVGLLGGLLVVALLVERLAARKRSLLRDGVVSLARVRPSAEGLGDILVGTLAGVASSYRHQDASRRIAYEYATGPASSERCTTRVRTDDTQRRAAALPDHRFPEGFAEGARFVVLFDRQRPARHIIYHPGDLVRIVPPRAE